MRLSDLLAGMPILEVRGDLPDEVSGITKDSRDVEKGNLFFATGSSKAFVHEAVQKGASAVISDGASADAPCSIIVSDPRTVLGRVVAKFYGFPSKKLHITGVTGTNGKTTTTYLVESMLRAWGKKAGVIGTISYRFGDNELRRPNTTPESTEIQKLLFDMIQGGVEYAIMEVSSHALDQHRVEGIDFDIGIFTNLTHDHLDYHGTLERYREAKRLLFEHYLARSSKAKRYSILNLDDPLVGLLATKGKATTLKCGIEHQGDAFPTWLDETVAGLSLGLSVLGRELEVSSPMVGTFNVSNILAAVLYGYAIGMPFEIISKGICDLSGVPGRLERVANTKGFHVFVDYAHTPDALMKTLKTVNSFKTTRLLLLFGCGGDRDKAKRPVMGGIASEMADFTVVTSDNPRTEDPRAIIDDIVPGLKGNNFKIVEDRKEAIHEIIRMARPEDIIVVAGKGHEDYQIIGQTKYHFSDREVIEECLSDVAA
jgi:UDP-N-acetylmuramoyl-L-alanyl-D-glutamate--2,6-diaminopimelate ligase